MATDNKLCYNLRLRCQDEDEDSQEVEQEPQSKSLLCPSCNNTFLASTGKEIPKHSLYKIQLKYSTTKRKQRGNNSCSMYDSVKVCGGCFQKYIKEVKKEDTFLRPKTTVRVRTTSFGKQRSSLKMEDDSRVVAFTE